MSITKPPLLSAVGIACHRRLVAESFAASTTVEEPAIVHDDPDDFAVDLLFPSHIPGPRPENDQAGLLPYGRGTLGEVEHWCKLEGKSREMSADLRRSVRCHAPNATLPLSATLLLQIAKLLLSLRNT